MACQPVEVFLICYESLVNLTLMDPQQVATMFTDLYAQLRDIIQILHQSQERPTRLETDRESYKTENVPLLNNMHNNLNNALLLMNNF